MSIKKDELMERIYSNDIIIRRVNIHSSKSIPWHTRWDTSWPGGDLWGCTEGILDAVKGIDGWPGSGWDWWCTKGR